MSGVTAKIRQKLQFTDEVLWKSFSARRLKLIEENQLFAKKASDQDQDVKKVANLLSKEYSIKEDYLDDVDKLVRAAIQSIRRNRKRSSKSKKTNDNNNEFIIIKNDQLSVNSSNNSSPEKIISNNRKRKLNQNLEIESDDGEISDTLTTISNPTHPTFLNDIMNVDSLTKDIEEPVSKYSKKQKITNQDVSRNIISSFTQTNFNDAVTDSIDFNLNDLHNSIRQKSLTGRNSILELFKKSKTCEDSTNNDWEINEESSIYHLGKCVISTSISYLLCKIFPENDINSSTEYLRFKLNSMETFNKLLRKLDYEKINHLNLNEKISANSLCYLIGCCANDYNFNQIIEPLSCVIYEIILDEFPMINLVKKFPIDNTSYKKQVEIKFKERFLQFTFDISHNSMPTLMEVILNCKKAFGIIGNQKVLTLRDHQQEDHRIISTDHELSTIFKKNEKILIELCFLTDLNPSEPSLPQLSLSLPGILNNNNFNKPPLSAPLPSRTPPFAFFRNSVSTLPSPPPSVTCQNHSIRSSSLSSDTSPKERSSSVNSDVSLENPYQISSIQSYTRSTQQLKPKTFVAPRFERLL